MKTTPRTWGLALVFASGGLLALACGGTSGADSTVGARDGAADTTSDSAPSDARAADVIDAAQSSEGARCAGATYSAAPSGAACDPKRIEQQRGLEGTCYGPGVGAFCRSFQVSVQSDEQGALPSGFVCGSPELGVVTCVWSFGDGAASVIDDAALEAACAVTVALSKANVVCTSSGS